MRKLFFISLLLVSALQLKAQSFIESPYSRYGLGELSYSTEPVTFSMGGLTAGFRDKFVVNSFNPASYTAFDSISFVFNGGFKGNYTHLRSETGDSYPFSMGLNSMLFGFRAARNWGIAFGLQPYSSVGYLMSTTSALDSTTNYTTTYEGSGGYNKFYAGTGIKLFKNLSIGLNASYIFGSINQSRRLVFDTSIYLSAKSVTTRFLNDLSFDAGLQYQILIKRDTSFNQNTVLTIGGSFGLPSELRGKESQLAVRYYTVNGFEYALDTTGQSDNVAGTVVLPYSITAGFVLARENKWSFGADMNIQNWSEYSAFGESDSLKNSFSIHAGGSYTPIAGSNDKLWKRMTYYGGFHYEKSYLSLRNQQLSKVGISFGCSFPLRPNFGNSTIVHTGIELGKMGTTDQSLIEENYIRFVLGLSIKEQWFVKRKYN
ncbi:MAG: hypothetical protein CVU11_02045 [Bacteroidetes bacterium HGW-Bacteroidetes-6]|jgi:hypothetical protein|nr:MAG: hypothetical protein CVU11_02045 [Bacteroidetes bacterium HGW-Bacteroidetes-6]